MKKLLIISFSPISRDPRVLRQIEILSGIYDVEVMGFGPDPCDNRVRFTEIEGLSTYSPVWKIRGGIKLLAGWFESFYWNTPWISAAKNMLDGKKPNAVIANDLSALPIALTLEVPVLYDAHEYSPREHEECFKWRLFFQQYSHYLCKTYLPKVTSMITVCEGIRDEYFRRYGVSAQVVRNAPPWQNPEFRKTDPNRIRLIHHGAAHKSRQIELMIDMISLLDERFFLDLMLVGDCSYLASLRKRAAASKRIRFIDPVNTNRICDKLREYDVGVYLLKPINFNYAHALPNKFFEFIQAGLALAIGPSIEMKAVVRDYSCGVVADSFDAAVFAKKLNSLTANEVDSFKRASIRASKYLGFEHDADILNNLVSQLIN